MGDRTLDIAFWDYDRTRLLTDGSVGIAGVEPRFHGARIVTEIFEGMIRGRYDVSELGMTYFLRTFDDEGRSPFVAIPVFLNRAFRHGAVYVNRASGIARPQDLAGKRIGELALYGHDAGVMAKGVLSDEFAWRPEQSRWVVGGIDFPMEPIDFVARTVPPGVEVEWVGKDVDLGDMLEAGDLDALVSADVPEAVLSGSPRVGRLFEEHRIDREQVQRLLGDARRDVHDDAGPALAKLRQHRLHHGKRPERVRLEELAHGVHRRAFEGVQPADAGIVDQDVDGSRGLDGLADARRVGDVEGEHAQAVGGGQTHLARRAHGGHHVPPPVDEEAGGLKTEPGRAAGDQDGLHVGSNSL